MNDYQLYQGDCLEILKTLKTGSVDAVITDPPYGMKNNTDSSRFSGGKSPFIRRRGSDAPAFIKPIIGDDKEFDPAPFIAFPEVILWGYHHFANKLPTGSVLVWQKKDQHLFGTFLSDADLAWKKNGHGVYIFQRNWSGFSRLTTVGKASHPNEKPIELMEWCIEKVSQAGDTIFDPYMGSGTTGVACMQLGRRFIGCEIDPDYFKVAERRISQAARQPSLFETESKPQAVALELAL